MCPVGAWVLEFNNVVAEDGTVTYSHLIIMVWPNLTRPDQLLV